MIVDYLDECLQRNLNEIDSLNNPNINRLKRYILKYSNEEKLNDIIIEAIKKALAYSYMFNYDEKEIIDEFICNLNLIKENMTKLRTSYIFEVKVDCLEDEINRIIEVPSLFTLADLVYAILGCMNIKKYKDFSISFRGRMYVNESYKSIFDDYVRLDRASELNLSEANLRKGTTMTLKYTFAKLNYVFNIAYIDHILNDKMFDTGNMRILDGKGNGIWEDQNHLLYLYITDYHQFEKEIEKTKYTPESYIKKYDGKTLEKRKKSFENDYYRVKSHYTPKGN